MPIEEDLPKAYTSYYTHENSSGVADSVVRNLYRQMQREYLHSKYGYPRYNHNLLARLLWPFLAFHPPRRELLDFSVFWLRSKRQGRLLEVGCGSGASLKSMAELGWQVEGVDFDPVAVGQARKDGLKAHLGTLSQQHFVDNSFDAVVARHLIEHLPDPVGMLRECYRILNPGGVLVVITPNARSWGHRFYRMDWRGLEPPRHLRIFTRPALAKACSDVGFKHVDCRSVVRFNTILSESRALKFAGTGYPNRASSFTSQLWAEVESLRAWLKSLTDREVGEEIVLSATK